MGEVISGGIGMESSVAFIIGEHKKELRRSRIFVVLIVFFITIKT